MAPGDDPDERVWFWMRRPWNRLLGFLCGVGLTALWAGWSLRDIDFPGPADLMLPAQDIPEERDGMAVLVGNQEMLEDLAPLLHAAEESGKSFAASDFPEAVAGARTALDTCAEFFARPGLRMLEEHQLCESSGAEVLFLPGVLARAAMLEARTALEAGDPARVARSLDQAITIGVRLSDASRQISESLLGMAILHRTIAIVSDTTTQPSVEMLETLLGRMRELASLRPGFEQALRGEFRLQHQLIAATADRAQSARPWLPQRIFYKPGVTRRECAEILRGAIRLLEDSGEPELPDVPDLSGNKFGEGMSEILRSMCLSSIRKLYALENEIRLVQVGLALRIHELEHGELPAEISAIAHRTSAHPGREDFLSELSYSPEGRWYGFAEPEAHVHGDPRVALPPLPR